jgi:hypothetical protein
MKMSHRLIPLGLAFSLLGSTCALARPMPLFENCCLSYKSKTVTDHVPTTRTYGAIGYARRPSSNAVKDDWPANMLLG